MCHFEESPRSKTHKTALCGNSKLSHKLNRITGDLEKGIPQYWLFLFARGGQTVSFGRVLVSVLFVCLSLRPQSARLRLVYFLRSPHDWN